MSHSSGDSVGTRPWLRSGVVLVTATMALAFAPMAMAGNDCNGNGIPDALDIKKGTSQDCQPDGIPDECQTSEPIEYGYDSGPVASLSANTTSALVVTRFVAAGAFPYIGGVVYDGLEVPQGTVVNIGVWSDPDGDGDPSDAILLESASDLYEEDGAARIVFDLGIEIGGDGTSFFIGLWVEDVADWAIGFDTGSLARQGFAIIQDGTLDPGDLSAAVPASSLCSGCNGDWTIRALACDQPWCATGYDVDGDGIPDDCEPDCNMNDVPDDADIATGASTDCDGDGVPDDCQNFEDCDGDGLLDVCAVLPGTGLARSVWDNITLYGPPLYRDTVSNIDFNTEEGDSTPGVSDFYSIEWKGALTTPTSGTYRLRFDADDRFRCWIDGFIVLGDNDDPQEPGQGGGTVEIEMEAGVPVAFRARFYEEGGGERCRLWWTPPGGNELIIPQSAFTPAVDRDGDGQVDVCAVGDCNQNGVSDDIDLLRGSSDCNEDGIPDICQPELDCDGDLVPDQCVAGVNGLVGTYFASPEPGLFGELLLARVDADLFFDWGGQSPDPRIPDDRFAVRWVGTIVAQETGVHRFRLNSDDGVRAYIDGEQVVDAWFNQSGGDDHVFDLDLVAGERRAVRIEYYEDGGSASCRFRWRLPGETGFDAVPSGALVPLVDVDGDGVADPCAPDCDGDGVSDAVAIAEGLSEDCNGNGVPDECDLGFVADDVVAWWRFEDPDDLGRDDGPFGLQLDVFGAGASGDTPVEEIPRTGDTDLGSTSYDFSNRLTTLDPDRRLSLVENRFTAEAWVRIDELATDASTPAQRQWLFQRKNPTSDGRIEWAFLVQSGNIHEVSEFGIFGSDLLPTGRQLAVVLGTGSANGSDKWCVLSDLQIADNEWHHVSIGWDPFRSEVRFELDGVVDLQRFENRGLNPNAHRFAIGGHVNESGTWNQGIRGLVDEVRIRTGLVPLEEMLDRPYSIVSSDDDANGIPDECRESPCPQDLDGNGIVDGSDLGTLFTQWGGPGSADFDGNGTVDGSDLGALFVGWGLCP